MKPTDKVRRITGWILSGLLGASLMLSGASKLIALQPAVEMFEKFGLRDWLVIIGVVEFVGAALFLIPRTAVLGVLLLSAFLGGVIVTNMQHGGPVVVPSVVLMVLWVSAGLRMPELFLTLLRGEA